MDILYWLAGVIYNFMSAMPEGWPWGFSFLWWGLIAAIPLTIVHELGHAVVAAHRLEEEVEVTVGGPVKLAQVRMGRSLTAGGAWASGLNLVPFKAEQSDSTMIWTDGRLALDALRVMLGGPSAR